jgi:hypothetical protein
MQVRVVIKYRHCDGNLRIKVTDDAVVCSREHGLFTVHVCLYPTLHQPLVPVKNPRVEDLHVSNMEAQHFRTVPLQVRMLKSRSFGLYIQKHPFKLVASAISATPVADRCIEWGTWPWNLQRQTLAVEWPYWRALLLSTWHCHRMPPFQQVSSSYFWPARVLLLWSGNL